MPTATQDSAVFDVRRDAQTLIITMRREQQRNVIDAEMTAQLDAALNLLDDDLDLRAGILASEDLREGLAAFAEKGAPRWSNR